MKNNTTHNNSPLLKREQPRAENGRYKKLSFFDHLKRAVRRGLLVSIIIVTIYGVYVVNREVNQFIDNSNAVHDRLMELERENARLELELEQSVLQARKAEAVRWSDNSGEIVLAYLRDDHKEAQRLLSQQGDWLDTLLIAKK